MGQITQMKAEAADSPLVHPTLRSSTMVSASLDVTKSVLNPGVSAHRSERSALMVDRRLTLS